MGFDIKVCKVIDGKAYIRKCVHHGYFSYNWGDLKESTGWYIRDDLFGRNGNDVAQRIRDTLKRLEDQGYQIGEPDLSQSGWGWGCSWDPVNKTTVKAPHEQRVSVFMFHLNSLLEIAEKYSDLYFLGSDTDNTPEEYYDYDLGKFIKWQYGIDSDDESDENTPVTYFRHPIKGNMEVKTFDDAMEIFGIFRATGNNEIAERWKQLAFQMKGAP